MTYPVTPGVNRANAEKMKERIERDVVKLNTLSKKAGISEQYELKEKDV